ncbi:MAG: hypothetical protein IKZ34_00425 [Alphaproteobacteria bacterium]|nr:hypothetical protein [Alphaproteobacteria bacterium]
MNFIKKISLLLLVFAGFFTPSVSFAADIVEALDFSVFVPMVLDSLMLVATGIYEFFVQGENHQGVIYIFIWTFFAFSVAITLIKMYLPSKWVVFFGFSKGGELIEGNITATKIAENVVKPGVRVLVATMFLLQLKPLYLTNWLVNPFLEFGSLYTQYIISNSKGIGSSVKKAECPPEVLAKEWVSKKSCEFLTQPVSDLAQANNKVIKQGYKFLTTGLRGMLTLIPHGGENFLNLITGILLIFTFVGSNIFMTLLVIQGIFNFGIQLILYPFYVLTYVFKSNEKWLDIWPAFSGVTKALQQLIVTMIACAFILSINVAVINALFRWNSSVFVVAAGGSASGNLPQATSDLGFGQHSVLWLSAILAFYLMYKIFDLTRQQLDMYVGKGMDGMYNTVTNDAKTTWRKIKALKDKIKEYRELAKK